MPKVRKDTTLLLDHGTYHTANTSLLTFHFEPHCHAPSLCRLKQTTTYHSCIDNKDLYILDHFFIPPEDEELRHFSQHAPFSLPSYGSSQAVARGEKPALSMNGKERWNFFSKPPQAITEVYHLLNTLAAHLNADIATLPWVLCDTSSHGSPAVIANKLTRASRESMDLGKHQDSNPAKNICFGIPILYSSSQDLYPSQFTNGSVGYPWLITLMVYATEEAFLPHYQMGTAFYKQGGDLALCVNCQHMRLIFFESDLFHSIEESAIPSEIETWRVSYVFKLVINPKSPDLDLKTRFLALLRSLSGQMTTICSHLTTRL